MDSLNTIESATKPVEQAVDYLVIWNDMTQIERMCRTFHRVTINMQDEYQNYKSEFRKELLFVGQNIEGGGGGGGIK